MARKAKLRERPKDTRARKVAWAQVGAFIYIQPRDRRRKPVKHTIIAVTEAK